MLCMGRGHEHAEAHVVMRDCFMLVCLVQRRRGLQMTRVHLLEKGTDITQL